MRKAFTLIELLVVIAIIAILCGCLLGPGGLDGLVALCIGWVRYPLRLFDETHVDWFAVILCSTCLALLTIGVHWFGCWLAAHRATSWPWTRTLKLIGLLMLMFIAGITAIGVTHEIVWLTTTKERLTEGGFRAAYAVQARNNLKQLALAGHDHQDRHKTLPAGATFDVHGRGLHGWQTALLPHLDQQALHKDIDLTVPWNDPKNAKAMAQTVNVFINPGIGIQEPRGDYAPSHYAGNTHIFGGKAMKLGDIRDGGAQTLLFGEVAHHIRPWGMPMNCRDPAVGLNVPHGFASPTGKAVTFALADGSVRTIRADVSPAVLQALAAPAGNKIDLTDVDR